MKLLGVQMSRALFLKPSPVLCSFSWFVLSNFIVVVFVSSSYIYFAIFKLINQ